MKYRLILLLTAFTIWAIFTGCNTVKNAVEKQPNSNQQIIKPPDSIVLKQAKGIDFFAEGSSPVPWTLEMDFDHGYYFKTSDGITVNIAAIKPASTTKELRRYFVQTTQGETTILLYETNCSTGKKRTEVKLNNTLYTGCGASLFDPKLNGKWILEKAMDKFLTSNNFKKGLPILTFNIANNKVSGYDGCSDFTGDIIIEGSRINFGALNQTTTKCSNDFIQKIFLEKVSNEIASYYFKDGKLYLYLIDDSLLIFKKG